MSYDELLRHFGSQSAAARALRVSPQVVHAWKARGQIPIGWQQAIEAMTSGALVRDQETLPSSKEAAA